MGRSKGESRIIEANYPLATVAGGNFRRTSARRAGRDQRTGRRQEAAGDEPPNREKPDKFLAIFRIRKLPFAPDAAIFGRSPASRPSSVGYLAAAIGKVSYVIDNVRIESHSFNLGGVMNTERTPPISALSKLNLGTSRRALARVGAAKTAC